MKRIFLLFTAIYCLLPGTAWAQSVFVQYEKKVPQIEYAARKLTDALIERQYDITDAHTDYDFLISLTVHPDQLGAEAYSIIPEDKMITISGGDRRGLIYGTLALVEF